MPEPSVLINPRLELGAAAACRAELRCGDTVLGRVRRIRAGFWLISAPALRGIARHAAGAAVGLESIVVACHLSLLDTAPAVEGAEGVPFEAASANRAAKVAARPRFMTYL